MTAEQRIVVQRIGNTLGFGENLEDVREENGIVYAVVNIGIGVRVYAIDKRGVKTLLEP